ncbi:hypothetical protein VM636_06750 [Streptomyces sp. SCSIO 75703]|uniref:hypothetical protein n=1 Tax=Streptomyces sp. SCSIO 75703 TaxID=3112165 RepID=UPI0030D4A01C
MAPQLRLHTSSTSPQFSYEDGEQGRSLVQSSVFTTAVVESLRQGTGDLDVDGRVGAEAERVHALAARGHGDVDTGAPCTMDQGGRRSLNGSGSEATARQKERHHSVETTRRRSGRNGGDPSVIPHDAMERQLSGGREHTTRFTSCTTANRSSTLANS